jgi:hypothetical protein
MASEPGSQPFRKRLFGYAPKDVDGFVRRAAEREEADAAELERLRSAPDVSPEVATHLAALLQSFAETVAEGQREAEERAAQIVADAEDRAAQLEANALRLLDQANEMVARTYAEADTRYQEALSARQQATERIGEAVERLADALAVLSELPERLPGVVPSPPAGALPLPGDPGPEPGQAAAGAPEVTTDLRDHVAGAGGPGTTTDPTASMESTGSGWSGVSG